MAGVELPPKTARLTCSALRARVLRSMGFANAMTMVPDCSHAASPTAIYTVRSGATRYSSLSLTIWSKRISPQFDMGGGPRHNQTHIASLTSQAKKEKYGHVLCC